MNASDQAFLDLLRATFRIEAAEHLQGMTAGLLELERTPPSAARAGLVESVFRAAHSLKGAARAVDFFDVETLCQSLEEIFSGWKRAEDGPQAIAFDAAHRLVDAITAAVGVYEPVATAPSAAAAEDPPQPPPAAVPEQASLPAAGHVVGAAVESVRIPVATVDARLVEAEELLIAKLLTAQLATDLRELNAQFTVWWKVHQAFEQQLLRGTRPAAGERGGVSDLHERLEASKDTMKSIESVVARLGRAAERDHRAIAKLVDDLLDGSKRLLLVPFGSLSSALRKLVRDLCRSEGKEADLTIRGEDIEVDKRILEELKDPLVHLLRNSIDHGIATPAARDASGKAARGAIALEIARLPGSRLRIVVADDGVGIDTAKVRASAVKSGLLAPEEAAALDEAAVTKLIFQSELTTREAISRVSGRGLGLAIVREKIEKLSGNVAVESSAGTGTTFRIVVPALRATHRGVLVEVAGQVLVLPTTQVERVMHLRGDEIAVVEDRETISSDGIAMALLPLADLLELPMAGRRDAPSGAVTALLIGAGGERVALSVDAVLGEQEVLIKPLRKPLSRVRNVAAATVLGTGQVAAVLDVDDLLKSARRAAGAASRSGSRAPLSVAGPPAHSVLIAEDSITSRMLLKAILESAGYAVTTAVDGLDALSLLRSRSFDLLVSDVEMPRLNGFDLTARIRADRRLADLPVVLVTAMEAPEHRERGIDAGANAYLVKSSLEQSDLVAAVRRLIGPGGGG